MATILDKDVIRESTIMVGDRLIIITIGADQTISMKLKGMKSGSVSIPIEELYNQLNGSEPEAIIEKTKSLSVPTGGNKKVSGDPMISLFDIRHRLNISGFDYSTTAKLDSIMNEIIEDAKKS